MIILLRVQVLFLLCLFIVKNTTLARNISHKKRATSTKTGKSAAVIAKGVCYTNIDFSRNTCVDPVYQWSRILLDSQHNQETLPTDNKLLEMSFKTCCCNYWGAGWMSNHKNSCQICPFIGLEQGKVSKDFASLCGPEISSKISQFEYQYEDLELFENLDVEEIIELDRK